MKAIFVSLFLMIGAPVTAQTEMQPDIDRRRAVAADRPLAGAGLDVTVFARKAGEAAAMAVDPKTGDVLVLDAARGRLLRLRDRNKDGVSELKSTYLSGFHRPSGLVIGGGYIYISDAAGVWRAALSEGLTARSPARLLADLTKVQTAAAPRPIALIEDGKALLLGLGAKTERSEEPAPAASIIRVDSRTGKASVFATGLKQVMALRVFGDDQVAALVSETAPAPDYFTTVTPGDFYGWPYAYGAQIAAPGMARKDPYRAASMRAPLYSFEAGRIGTALLMSQDSRALSIAGLTGKNIIIGGARGLSVISVDLAGGILDPDGENAAPILTGFESARGRVWGRPSALAVDGTGALLVADRLSETIWRVTTAPPAPVIAIDEAEKVDAPEPEEIKEAKDEPQVFRTQIGRTRPRKQGE